MIPPKRSSLRLAQLLRPQGLPLALRCAHLPPIFNRHFCFTILGMLDKGFITFLQILSTKRIFAFRLRKMTLINIFVVFTETEKF